MRTGKLEFGILFAVVMIVFACAVTFFIVWAGSNPSHDAVAVEAIESHDLIAAPKEKYFPHDWRDWSQDERSTWCRDWIANNPSLVNEFDLVVLMNAIIGSQVDPSTKESMAIELQQLEFHAVVINGFIVISSKNAE